MKRVIGLLTVGSVLAATTASAADVPFFNFKSARTSNSRPSVSGTTLQHQPGTIPSPAPAAESNSPQSMPQPVEASHGSAEEVELYHCVEYEDLDNVHPCAVPKIVSVKDPNACYDPCTCCEPGCVFVKICVPPCGCPKVKVKRHGRKVKYDYGDYRVEVESHSDGTVEVDYDRSLLSRLRDLGKSTAH